MARKKEANERRKMETELRNLAKFPSENPNAILRFNKNGVLLYSNPASKNMLGKMLEESDQKLPEHWHKHVTEALSSGNRLRFEEQINEFIYSFLVAPLVSEGYVNIYGEDITERKRAEQALQQARRDWERTFDSVPDLIAIIDKQHRIVRANRAMAQRLGTTPERCVGLTCYQCVHGTKAPTEFCPHALTVQDGKEHVAEIYEDNLGGYFAVSTTPLRDEQGNMVGSVHVARDITQSKEAETALQEKQRDLNRAQAVAHTGSWRLDTHRNELLWSEETYRMFGITTGTPLTYETFLGTIHPDDRAYVDKKWNAALHGAPYDIEHRIMVNGEVKWVREKAELDFTNDGKLLGGFGTVQEITERKEMEQELRTTLEASQRRQAEISALLGASKAVLQHQEFRNSARSIFDSCKELVGATAGYVALLSKDDKENEVLFLDSGGLSCRVDPLLPMPVRGLRGEAYHTGKVVYCNDFQRSEWINLMPEGHAALQNVLFAPLTIDKKTVGIIGLANKPDGFTERDAQMALAFGEIASVALINSRMLETLKENEKLLKAHSEQLERLVEERTKRLKDAERLATIGETAGMVGHDIRNPLQSIIGELYLAKDELTSLPENDAKRSLEETVTMIEEQASYINKIVTDLQDFAKPLKPCNEETNLESIVQGVISSMDIPENIELTYAFKEEFPKFEADTAYIKRILTNLFSNAVQAMPNGGKLVFNASHESGSVMISVEDTGVGIPEEAKPRLFQPLFTTKSKGQGFGLAVCKRLVEAMNGTISFDSQEGKGTRFTIKLPTSSNMANQ